MAHQVADAAKLTWHARHSLGGYGVALGGLALVVWSYVDSGLSFSTLLSAEGRRQMGLFVHQMFPPDLSPGFLRQIAYGAVETLAISFLGTVLAIVL